MRSSWPVNSLPDSGADRGFVLIAAVSGRALAAAASRAGYRPLVVDLFGDLDTQALAAASVREPGGLSRGFRRDRLLPALEDLAAARAPVGLVYGTGFEDRPALLQAVADRYPLLGNSPATVRKVKRPVALAALCRRLGIPHPPMSRDGAGEGPWLEKRAGGSGGGHVRPARQWPISSRRHYLQRQLPGRTIAALVLADGARSIVLGFTEQWAEHAPGLTYRYGGAVRPAEISSQAAAGMTDAIDRIVPEVGLVGLNSADFVLDEDDFHLLEINPRPGATLDVFSADSLFHLHVEASRGRLPAQAPLFTGAKAAAVVYTRRRVVLPPNFGWPPWTADWQPSGVLVRAGEPLCTVLADAETPDRAYHDVVESAIGMRDYAELAYDSPDV
jgi:predicted ATP-grasp superfamily ATP-dependent carboligase